jgi:thiamine biosynthesis lipoprotein
LGSDGDPSRLLVLFTAPPVQTSAPTGTHRGKYGQLVPDPSSRRSWVEQIMGMPISVLARGEGARSPAADRAVGDLFRELVGVDAVFSLYKPDSDASRLARGEVRWDECDPDIRVVADRCAEAKELTGGLFDADRPDGTWDPSGLVKGWAAERAARRLAGVPVDWCLNAGGDVLVLSPSGEVFSVGIQDPRDVRRVAVVVPCAAGAVATSGTAARGAHLYDPRNGSAASTSWLSISVLGPSLEMADVLATAAFVAGDRWQDVVALVPGYAGLGIDAAGARHGTPSWPVERHGRLGA